MLLFYIHVTSISMSISTLEFDLFKYFLREQICSDLEFSLPI